MADLFGRNIHPLHTAFQTSEYPSHFCFRQLHNSAALPERETGYGTSVTGVPERANQLGSPVAENPLEYKTDHKKGKGKKDHK